MNEKTRRQRASEAIDACLDVLGKTECDDVAIVYRIHSSSPTAAPQSRKEYDDLISLSLCLILLTDFAGGTARTGGMAAVEAAASDSTESSHYAQVAAAYETAFFYADPKYQVLARAGGGEKKKKKKKKKKDKSGGGSGRMDV